MVDVVCAEVRWEREPAVPAEPSLERTPDNFLTLPEVQGATDGPLFLYRESRLKGAFRKVRDTRVLDC